MKRVRDFLVKVGETGVSDTEASSGGQSEGTRFSSWHKVWDFVRGRLEEVGSPSQAIVLDPQTGNVIASFSSYSEQAEEEAAREVSEEEDDQGPPKGPWRQWESVRFATFQGVEFFENRDVKGYHWDLLDGAIHEVPFRLSYWERKAERHPNGVFAYCLGLIGEWRDMFVGQKAHVS